MKIFDWTNKVDAVLEKVINVCILLFSTALIFTVLLQVLDRYLDVPFRTIWTSEIARYLYIWVSIFAASISIKENSLVKVDLLVNKLPFHLRRIFELLSILVVIIVNIFLIFTLIELLPRVAKQTATASKLPMSFVYSAGVIAGVLFTVFSVTRFIRWIKYKELASLQEND